MVGGWGSLGVSMVTLVRVAWADGRHVVHMPGLSVMVCMCVVWAVALTHGLRSPSGIGERPGRPAHHRRPWGEKFLV